MRRAVALVLFAVVVLGCPKPPAQPIPTQGSCPQYCERLRTLGCPEGHDGDCVRVCEELKASVEPIYMDCVTNATSSSDVRGCGVRCETP